MTESVYARGLWIEWGRIHFPSDYQWVRILYNGNPISPWRPRTIGHMPGTLTPYRGALETVYP